MGFLLGKQMHHILEIFLMCIRHQVQIALLQIRVSRTASGHALMCTGGLMSVRTKTMPESGGPGCTVRRTFSPVCNPTPVAVTDCLRVRCLSIAGVFGRQRTDRPIVAWRIAAADLQAGISWATSVATRLPAPNRSDGLRASGA